MFDIGFSELIVIAIVALVVIGPERLPKVARTAGHLLGRLQRYVHDVKSDISREMQLDELKKMQADIQDSARSFERSISSEIQSVEQSLEQTVQSTEEAIKSLSAPAPEVHADNAALVPPESTVPVGPAQSSESTAPAESAHAPVKT
jgi:sec-independent protein translocase protein TatB